MEAPKPVRSVDERLLSRDPEVLLGVAAGAGITEDIALALLQRRDLPAPVIQALAQNLALLKHRKVMIAIVGHPRTPRHVSLPAIRQMYTFDLVKLALLPAVPSDIKIAIDETIVSRLEQTSQGERLSLAKQGSTRVAAELLLDSEQRVVHAALENPRMTEAGIVRALGRRESTAHLVNAVFHHPRWSLRRDVRIALLRSKHTALAEAIACAHGLPPDLLREVLSKSGMAEDVKEYLLQQIGER